MNLSTVFSMIEALLWTYTPKAFIRCKIDNLCVISSMVPPSMNLTHTDWDLKIFFKQKKRNILISDFYKKVAKVWFFYSNVLAL